MSEPKRKRGRPVNEELKELEETLGVSQRRVRQLIAEGGVDAVKKMGELRVLEKQIVIALRGAQTDRHQHDLERQKKLDSGELISADWAIETYVGAMLDLKDQLNNIPDRLCSKLNPENPEAARRILQEELATITTAVAKKVQS